MAFLFMLVGPPGSGKRTVGKELARLTGAALLDNHLVNDPIFQALGLDGMKDVPAQAWALAGQVRAAMHQAVRLAPLEVSHIFTHYLANQESEWRAYHDLHNLAAERGAEFVPVWLSCPLPELERRMPLPERTERLKIRDPGKLRELIAKYGMLPAPPQAIQLDTSILSPADAALLIATHAGALFR